MSNFFSSRFISYLGMCGIMAGVCLIGYLTKSTWQEMYAIITTMCIVYIALRIK